MDSDAQGREMQTATIVYYYVREVNFKSRSTGTYTTTVTNTAGEYTLWPMFPGTRYPDDVEVLSLPITLPLAGGLSTCTEPLSPATQSPPRTTLVAMQTLASQQPVLVEEPMATPEITDVPAKGGINSPSPPTSAMPFGMQGTICAAIVVGFIAVYWLRRRRRHCHGYPPMEEKPKAAS
jgi:hypothetical protein